MYVERTKVRKEGRKRERESIDKKKEKVRHINPLDELITARNKHFTQFFKHTTHISFPF